MAINNSSSNITEETILTRYESLPEDLKQALMGVETAGELYKIGKNANLSVEKIGRLAEEVGLIILGLTPSQNFISDLKQMLEVPQEKAEEVASEVNTRIFLPIRESLKRLHGASWSEGITKLPVTAERPRSAFDEGKKAPAFSLPPAFQKEPASPSQAKPEIKKPVMPPPLAAPIEKISLQPTTPSTPKEPLIIQPMGGASAITRPAPDRGVFKNEIRPPSLIPAERKPVPPPPPIIQPPQVRVAAPDTKSEIKKIQTPTPPPPPPVPPKIPIFEKPALLTPPEPLGQPSSLKSIEPRAKDLKPSPVPAERPWGVREDKEVKPSVQIPPSTPSQPGFDPYREPLE
ncbi:MAG: hypothetical protein HYW90_02305 [Candidatus Sungbacteria bacterium]|nr:hypothetical protein [Candidatus Sungbacteria bacterium]